jgi:hypothetical protein
MTTCRHFLKTTATAIAALILPRSLFARTPDHFFFIHEDSCTFWPVLDPVQWCLQNAHQPILERASQGLRKLSANDGDRIIRLGVWQDSLIVRLGDEQGEEALLEPHVKPFDITGTAMKGWVLVEPDGLADDAALRGWVQRAIKFVTKLPAK